MILAFAYLFGVIAALAAVAAIPGLLGYVAAIPAFVVSTWGMASTLLRARETFGGDPA